ncbi:MAG: serine hydrolase domain-containing protein, partial [Pyrinomonadaceae bacterium]
MRNFAIVSFVLVIFAGASEGANDGRCREAMAIGLASTQCTTEISQTDKNTKTQLRHYLERLESFGFSGQVLVVDKGHIVVHSGYGGARRDPFKAVSVNTVFDIASLTKQFTAAAILSLEMDGKLKTSDPISKYLDSVPIDKAAITVQQLITHMSGLRRDLVQNATIDFVSRDELIKRTLESKLLAEPGKNFIYSNAGYHLLAAIIEKLSGQSFFNYLNYKLFEPAGMRSTFSQTDRRKKPLAAYPNNEWRELSEYVDRPESWHLFGPSGISSTAGDIRKWTQAIMTNKIFTNEARDKFLARQAPLEEGVFYGCGWFVEKAKNGGDLISSGGDVAGYHSEFRWERQTDRLIIVLTNQDVFGLSGGAVQKR